MAVETREQTSDSGNEPHDRITHMDLFNLWRGDMQALRADIDKRFSEMRWLIGMGFAAIGAGFAVLALLIAFATFVR